MEGSHDRDHRDYDLDPVFRSDIQWRLRNYGDLFGFGDQQSCDCDFSGHGAEAPQVFEGK
jgi:hypothetical protein